MNRMMVFGILLLLPIGLLAQFAGGSGTAEDPYLVATPEHLNNVRNYLDAHFLQIADIDLDVAPYNEGEGWVPIGENRDSYFIGCYDGNGFDIANLFIDRPDSNYIGLFGCIGYNSEVSNVVLVNTVVVGCYSVGSLAGWSWGGIVSNCSTSGNVIGSREVGGLIGESNSGYIMYCRNSSNVCGHEKCGGISGTNFDFIESSSNTGTISGGSDIGGIVGYNGEWVIRCYNTGQISGDENVGGIMGCNFWGHIIDSYNMGNVTGEQLIGGISGYVCDGCITRSYNTGYVSGNDFGIGGICGGGGSYISGCYWNTDNCGQVDSQDGYGFSTQEMTYPYAETAYFEWDFDSTWVADVDYINGGYPYLQHVPLVTGISKTASISQKQPTSLTNYPNPFNPTTTIEFSLNERSMVNLSIYNIKGQLVKALVNNEQYDIGSHSIVWSGKDSSGNYAASGVYFYKLESGEEVITKKMILMK